VDQAYQTKTMLSNALKTLMQEKPFNKITIRDLTETCGLQRQTFYYHFQDIYALLEWTYHEEVLSLVADYDSPSSWFDATLKVLYFIKDNDEICLNALQSMGRKQLYNFFYKDFFLIYTRMFKEIAKPVNPDDKFIEFISEMMVFGTQGYIMKWIESGLNESPEQILEWFKTVIEAATLSIATNQANTAGKKS